jgi:glycosyltransferase involved in cell wall biosynthesis
MGMHVEVVTPRHGTYWANEFYHGPIRVHRYAAAPKGEWLLTRYVRHLAGFLASQAPQFDWIVCDGINEDVRSVATAINQVRSDKSLAHQRRTRGAVLCDGWGVDGDDLWCRQSGGGQRCLQAIGELDQIITRHASLDRFLIADGITPSRIWRIAPSFDRPARVSLDERLASQRALAGINIDLKVNQDDRVLLWCGRIDGNPNYEGGVGLLVGSARILCARYPNLKIWILGDGKLHDWVHTELKAEGVRSVVAIPGTFPEMTDVWNSVDGVVVTDEDQLRYTLPTAISHALPTIVANHAGIRAWMKDKFPDNVVDSFAWFEFNKPVSFRKSFRLVWDDLPTAIDLAWEVAVDAARRHNVAEEHQRWLSVLTSDSVTGTPKSPYPNYPQ